MKIDVNGILSGLKQILGVASVLLTTGALLKLFGYAPRSLPGSIYELCAISVAAAYASNAFLAGKQQ